MAGAMIPVYMRCTKCRRVNSQRGIDRRHGCTCGGSEFWGTKTTWLERVFVWLTRM